MSILVSIHWEKLTVKLGLCKLPAILAYPIHSHWHTGVSVKFVFILPLKMSYSKHNFFFYPKPYRNEFKKTIINK